MFPTGRFLATPGLLAFCRQHDINPIHILLRHYSMDWSEMCLADQRANKRAIEEGSRVFSAYTYHGEKVWVITEASREATTLLLATEY